MLRITYSVVVDVEIADDFPVTADEIQKIADWKTNDWRDGREPFDTELMKHGALSSARYHLEESVFEHYARRVEAVFGPGHDHIEGRNALVERCLKTRVGYTRVGHDVTIEARVFGATSYCAGCGQDTPAAWKECPCSPGVKLPEPPAIISRT